MEFDPSRRLFLRSASLATVAPVIAPLFPFEKAIKYFFAPLGGWTRGRSGLTFTSQGLKLALDEFDSTYLTPTIFTREALRILKANMDFSTKVYGDSMAGIGRTISFPAPERFSLSNQSAAGRLTRPDSWQ